MVFARSSHVVCKCLQVQGPAVGVFPDVLPAVGEESLEVMLAATNRAQGASKLFYGQVFRLEDLVAMTTREGEQVHARMPVAVAGDLHYGGASGHPGNVRQSGTMDGGADAG